MLKKSCILLFRVVRLVFILESLISLLLFSIRVINTLKPTDELDMSTSFHSQILTTSVTLTVHNFNNVCIEVGGSYTSVGLFGINSHILVLHYKWRRQHQLQNRVTL